MRRFAPPLLWLALFSCALRAFAAPAPASSTPDLRRAAEGVCDRPAVACSVIAFTRRPLGSGIAEYSIRLRVGPGAHDEIGLHRVVREQSPFHPAPTQRAVLLAHGDAWGFDSAFLASVTSPAAPDERALPIFLARRGIDVWGIDFRWTLLPQDTADLSFLASWGIRTDARDLGIALVFARGVRLATGQGAARIHLLGWSRGGQTALVYLNGESQLPPPLRQARGLIAVDTLLKSDDAEIRQAACTRLGDTQALLAAGQTAATSGQLFVSLGSLAEFAPAAASPIVPGVTNLDAARLAGSATYVFLGPGRSFVPFYHFLGGTFDAAGNPTGFSFTDQAYWFDFLQGASPLEPNRLLADGDEAICDQTDVPFDDHLGDIRVPALYLGAGGGIGDFGAYTMSLLGSPDVTLHVVALGPPDARPTEIGHVDIFTATNAPALFWQPLLDWIRAH